MFIYPPDNSYCIRDISRLGFERRRKNSETCAAVSETSGWSPAAITKPYGLSKKDLIIKVPKKLFTFEASSFEII